MVCRRVVRRSVSAGREAQQCLALMTFEEASKTTAHSVGFQKGRANVAARSACNWIATSRGLGAGRRASSFIQRRLDAPRSGCRRMLLIRTLHPPLTDARVDAR